MRLETLPSFRRCLRGLSDGQLHDILAIMKAAANAYGHPHRHIGVGLREIGDFLECRDTLDKRLIFRREAGAFVFHFYGTHGEVRAFLKNRR